MSYVPDCKQTTNPCHVVLSQAPARDVFELEGRDVVSGFITNINQLLR